MKKMNHKEGVVARRGRPLCLPANEIHEIHREGIAFREKGRHSGLPVLNANEIHREGIAFREKGRHAGLPVLNANEIHREGIAFREKGRHSGLPVLNANEIHREGIAFREKGRHAGLPVLIAMIIIALCIGCEKIIDVELNESAPAIVIEGNLSYNHSRLDVKVSRTGNYFDETPPATTGQAEVHLEDRTGEKQQAKPLGEGRYELQGLHLEQGTTYRLHVEAEGKSYTAASVLNPPVRIDSLKYEYVGETRFFESGYRLLVYFSDPFGPENYYRVKAYRNGELLNELDDLVIFDDSDLDGVIIRVRLRGQVFARGDTARVDLLSIDRNAWLFYSTFREMADLNPGSPAPANPASNFDNGALGYFSAWSGSSATTVIGE